MEINVSPIGFVSSSYKDPSSMPIHGNNAIIKINEEYKEGLSLIEQNSHLWILSWFHQSKRHVLKTSPSRIDPRLPQFGVFGLRAPNRPNPIALSLVKLVKVEDNVLYVENYDAIDGTPILDIKPYFEKDIIFSPKTPDIRPVSRDIKFEWFLMEGRNHHQEFCAPLVIAARMALIADEHLGKISDSDVSLQVVGHNCYFDVLQGLTRARFANPKRISFSKNESCWSTVWTKGDIRLQIQFDPNLIEEFSLNELLEATDQQLFNIF